MRHGLSCPICEKPTTHWPSSRSALRQPPATRARSEKATSADAVGQRRAERAIGWSSEDRIMRNSGEGRVPGPRQTGSKSPAGTVTHPNRQVVKDRAIPSPPAGHEICVVRGGFGISFGFPLLDRLAGGLYAGNVRTRLNWFKSVRKRPPARGVH